VDSPSLKEELSVPPVAAHYVRMNISKNLSFTLLYQKIRDEFFLPHFDHHKSFKIVIVCYTISIDSKISLSYSTRLMKGFSKPQFQRRKVL